MMKTSKQTKLIAAFIVICSLAGLGIASGVMNNRSIPPEDTQYIPSPPIIVNAYFYANLGLHLEWISSTNKISGNIDPLVDGYNIYVSDSDVFAAVFLVVIASTTYVNEELLLIYDVPGITKYIMIRAYNESGESIKSNIAVVHSESTDNYDNPSVPYAPDIVSADFTKMITETLFDVLVLISPGRYDLGFDLSIKGYKIYVSESEVDFTIKQTFDMVPNNVDGRYTFRLNTRLSYPYYVKCVAYNDNGDSEQSNIVKFSGSGSGPNVNVPGLVDIYNCFFESQYTARVDWVKPFYNGLFDVTVTSYVVKMSTSSTFATTLKTYTLSPSANNQYFLQMVPPRDYNLMYYIKVAAVNSAGVGSFTAIYRIAG